MNPVQAKLLIVDDCPSMREALRDLMQDQGIISIDEANDGAAALALFQRRPYDLVISDWNMPLMSGIDLLRAIRQGTTRSETPLILLSAELTIKHTVDALEARANGVLEKPFPVARLVEHVQRLISSLSPSSEFRYAPRAERVLRGQPSSLQF